MACCPAVLRTRRADLTEEEDSRQACQMLDKQRLKPVYLIPMRRGEGGQYAGRLGCEPKQRTAPIRWRGFAPDEVDRFEGSEEHPSDLQSLMRISYAVFC